MKKKISTLATFLLAALAVLFAGPFTTAAASPSAESLTEEGATGETKYIPVEVPAFVSNIRFSGRVQALWKIWGEKDPERWGAVGLGDILEDEGFRIPRWRFGVSVTLFEHVRFDVTMGESEFRNESDVNLLDALVTLTYIDAANVSFGAGKVPFGRQHLTSSKNMQFIFRPTMVENYVVPQLGADPGDYNPDDFNGLGVPDRDVGITVFGKLWEGIFKYYVGIYNGTGDLFKGVINHEKDTDFFKSLGDYAYVLRAEVNPLGDFSSVEADFLGDIKVGIGASGFFNDISLSPDFHNIYKGCGVDGAIRGFGFSLTGEWIWSEQKIEFEDNELDKTERSGFFVQAGYFVWPNYLEAVYRYEQFDDNDHFDDNGDIKYHTIGLNYYVRQNNDFKVQLNYIIRGEDGPEIFNDALYALAQVAF